MDQAAEFHQVAFAYDSDPVFVDLTLGLPRGVTSLAGPNGAGKTTLLLLASGRLRPRSGTVLLQGQDTVSLDEDSRNRLASLVFQNMEFETAQPLGELLEFVFAQGFLNGHQPGFLAEVTKVFELVGLDQRPTQNLSKGEMQRAVMAFSVLYGSQVVVMDEPVFALEDAQKRRALAFLGDHARSTGRSFLYSAHDIDLTREFSDQVVLLARGQAPILGRAAEVLTRPILEQAYQVPFALLRTKEQLYRKSLLERPGPAGATGA